MSKFWSTLDADTGLYSGEYAFGSQSVNTLVVRLPERRLLVLGPGIMDDAAYDELEALGEVVAAVSAGPFHHLGFPKWKKRFPKVRLFAGDKGCARIPNQHKGVDLGLENLAALQPLLPEHVNVGEVDGMRMPDLHAVIHDERGGATWFSNELLQNVPKMPDSFGIKMAFMLTGSKIGLGVNNFTRVAFGGSKGPIRSFFDRELESHGATRLVPSHGTTIESADLKEQLKEAFDRTL